MTAPAGRSSAIIPCAKEQCHEFETFDYGTQADKNAQLAANAKDPWSCERHRKRQESTA